MVKEKASRRIPKKVVHALKMPVQTFIQIEAASGIVLIAAALIAFVWANSPLVDSYHAMQHVTVGVGFGSWGLEMDLHHWVNDLLMALFFFLVGLEIKREILVGELRTWDKASLPAAAALGGMVIPALIYVGFNLGQESIRGWGVPMATDIAFALGVLALLGDRVPLSLKVFLLALAIVDDLGAVLVIAIFYTENLDLTALIISLVVGWIALLYGRAEGPRPLVYLLVGLVVWYFMLKSGVHATIAGVLMAFAIPLRHRMSVDEIKEELRWSSGRDFEQIETRIGHLEDVLHRAHSPLHSMEHTLQPWVAFVVMPVFALFNAGVTIGGDAGGAMIGAISTGAFLGLLLGKPIGVVAFVWLSVKTGFSRWPEGWSWAAMLGIGLLAGIGFTMSLFIANLAFGSGAELDQAKIGVLAASVVAAVVGLGTLRWALPKRASAELRQQEAAQEA
ncbi:MAG TPA: Na+/H+ antiporter NhaA [Geminicoccaceae bacterium]